MSDLQPERMLPRPTMLREITDGAVIDEVFRQGRITRAELATVTGISKPTISESVRRLELAGLLTATGSRTGRRGRVATFYEVAPSAGWALALEVNQSGIHARAADLAGQVFDSTERPPVPPGDAAALVSSLRQIIRRFLGSTERYGTVQAIALSVANPVDPSTQRIIALPGSPFPEGLVNPAEILADLVDVELTIDNDVNLAALAERRSGAGKQVESFAYFHIGAGLGLGLWMDGQLIRGARGLAGEIGYLPVSTASGAPSSLANALASLGFGRPDAPSIDVPAVLATLDQAAAGDATATAAIEQLAACLGQAIAAVCAINDPELVLLGGPIGSRTQLLGPIRTAVAKSSPLPTTIELGSIHASAAIEGALHLAVAKARSQILSRSRVTPAT